MFLKFVFMLCLLVTLVASEDNGFIYKGFQSSHLYLDGIAELTSTGLLRLTNDIGQDTAHAFYPNPIVFKNTSNSLPNQYLGPFNDSNIGNTSNHVFAVELDTIQDLEFDDINNNHAGIDINNLKSANSTPAGYYNAIGRFNDLSLSSGYPMQVWIEYDGVKKNIDVTLAPINFGCNVVKPARPLLSFTKDLSPILNNRMYVGFSSSTGVIVASHYILGWSFKVNGQAQNLEISKLPELRIFATELGIFNEKKESKTLTVGLPLIFLSLLFIIALRIMYHIEQKKFAKVLEDWEHEYGPHRFKFKDIYFATKGFMVKGLLGVGGFGRVYKGVIPNSKLEVVVKRVCCFCNFQIMTEL
ncbi:putative non-specific serine/threonine protein kinase [Medicago truncatula]|uniref:Putative non-specific serine/threonine protein kinase n=1 Tax=Medicago truncatula TaxID=3880 RepID=A0A396H4U4_MEDTR|nr:putative non-specific serine/threonine protein kinase [Medicago truncatula]